MVRMDGHVQASAIDAVTTVPFAVLPFSISLAAPLVLSNHNEQSPASKSPSAGAAFCCTQTPIFVEIAPTLLLAASSTDTLPAPVPAPPAVSALTNAFAPAVERALPAVLTRPVVGNSRR